VRYKLICDVEGALFLKDAPVAQSALDGVLYELIADPSTNRVTHAAASLQVPPSKLGSIASRLEPPLPGSDAKMHIVIAGDQDIDSRLVDALQQLESLLSLSDKGPRVRRIRWDVPSKEWIPESTEDEKYAQISGVSYSRNPRVIRSDLSVNSFEIMIQNADRYESLRTVSAFYRQGMVEFQDGQYIQSIYKFYFVIEDMFGHGRSDEDRVYEAFASEQTLTDCLQATLTAFPKDNDNNHSKLLTLMTEESFAWNIEDLRRFIIRLRNRLHHYRGRSPKRQGTPFTQKEFRPAALMMMHIVTNVVITRAVQLNKEFGRPEGPPPENT